MSGYQQLAEVPIALIRVANAQESKQLVWARMARGRQYHAKLTNDEDRAICGASPRGRRGYGASNWHQDDNKRPERGKECTDCGLIFDGALKAVAETRTVST